MTTYSPDCRFDLRSQPLELYVAGPLRTGLEIDVHRLGASYAAFRKEVRRRLRETLGGNGEGAPVEILLPDTAHGEPDDETAGDRPGGPEWSGFGSRPYRPTAFLELDRETKNLHIAADTLANAAQRLGCSEDPGCARFKEMSVRATRFNARLHDTGFAVLSVGLSISGVAVLSVEELRTLVDCAVEAVKAEVEERFERVRPEIVDAALKAAKTSPPASSAAGGRGKADAVVRDLRRLLPAQDRATARAQGYGYLIAFHRLFEIAYGDGLPNRQEAEAASERLLEKSHEGGLRFCRPHPDYAAYLGYLNSVYLFPGDRRGDPRTHRLSPRPVIRFYEFAFAALQDLDRALFHEIEESPRVLEGLAKRSRAERERRYIEAQDHIAERRERARLLEFRIEADIDSLPPAHLVYWHQILSSWRVPQLRAGIDEKIAFLELHYGNMHERMEADLTRRTNTIILFLTVITAFSVLADTLGFAFDARFAWGPNADNIGSLVLGGIVFGLAGWLYWTRSQSWELSRLARKNRRKE